MVMPCSRSACRPSTSSARSGTSPVVPQRRLSVGDRRELVVEYLARVVQQAADQRALAVVDRAAGDETQQVDVALLSEELLRASDEELVGGRALVSMAAI